MISPLAQITPPAYWRRFPQVFPLPGPPFRIVHLPYDEPLGRTLVPISANGLIKLKAPAARAFLAMQQAARAEQVYFEPVSSFRSITQQRDVFYGIAQQRRQTPAQRAQVSAPPGFSEHHTGLVVDVMDPTVPQTAELTESFEQTRAFAWLSRHAGRYGFQLSFPRNNAQGIAYEPWHWRFVGDIESRRIFTPASALRP